MDNNNKKIIILLLFIFTFNLLDAQIIYSKDQKEKIRIFRDSFNSLYKGMEYDEEVFKNTIDSLFTNSATIVFPYDVENNYNYIEFFKKIKIEIREKGLNSCRFRIPIGILDGDSIPFYQYKLIINEKTTKYYLRFSFSDNNKIESIYLVDGELPDIYEPPIDSICDKIALNIKYANSYLNRIKEKSLSNTEFKYMCEPGRYFTSAIDSLTRFTGDDIIWTSAEVFYKNNGVLENYKIDNTKKIPIKVGIPKKITQSIIDSISNTMQNGDYRIFIFEFRNLEYVDFANSKIFVDTFIGFINDSLSIKRKRKTLKKEEFVNKYSNDIGKFIPSKLSELSINNSDYDSNERLLERFYQNLKDENYEYSYSCTSWKIIFRRNISCNSIYTIDNNNDVKQELNIDKCEIYVNILNDANTDRLILKIELIEKKTNRQ